jgi:hypothetical protein
MKVKGIYDGTSVILLESVSLPPNTEVDVEIPEETITESVEVVEAEARFRAELIRSGLVLNPSSKPTSVPSFDPIVVEGEPVSETIIRNRR